MSSDLHRRKSSREEDTDSVLSISVTAADHEPAMPNGGHDLSPRKNAISSPERPNINGLSTNAYASGVPQRQRVLSTPSQPAPPTLYSPVSAQPPSAGPFRTSFPSTSPGPSARSPSHLRTSFSHARTASASSFYPPAPSPLSMSFPSSTDAQAPTTPTLPSPHRQAPPPPVPMQDHRRRHSRIHSRNLSIYFPRPGTLPPASIAEDGAQEIELGSTEEAPETLISSAPLQQGRELERGFRFGGKNSSQSGVNGMQAREVPVTPASAGFVTGGSRPSKRGHHHKHSLSHNFFSFMEPEASVQSSSPSPSPAPTPAPMSSSFSSTSWQPITPFPATPPPQFVTQRTQSAAMSERPSRILSSPAFLVSVTQFALGSALWVAGQECGSLACTGLGYWVVFDALGVACSDVLPSYLTSASAKPNARPYGNARLETLAVFAQSLYLIFASVYVCKEAVEHMLLSHGEGHHHHRGDDTDLGIEFPTFLITLSLLSLAYTSIAFDNNSRLINATANRIPSFSSLIQSIRYASKPLFVRPPPPPPPTSLIGRAASNPYSALPVGTALGVLSIRAILHESQQRPADLFLSAVLAALTFTVAYPAALALAKVLLQTAPERGAASGRMEAFLRTMRDLERHPQVLHLPPPHIWQLTGEDTKLIVTLELHVRNDADVMELTRWAWERCMGALKGADGGAEVTVGVVRG